VSKSGRRDCDAACWRGRGNVGVRTGARASGPPLESRQGGRDARAPRCARRGCARHAWLRPSRKYSTSIEIGPSVPVSGWRN